jgi:hypothetical protein
MAQGQQGRLTGQQAQSETWWTVVSTCGGWQVPPPASTQDWGWGEGERETEGGGGGLGSSVGGVPRV